MPNWCSNTLRLRSTKEKISKLNSFLDERSGKDFFDAFIANAKDAGEEENFYSYNREHYGCKWNCDASDWMLENDGESILITFDSPWGPPATLYYTLVDEEWEVEAEYYEPGVGFVGRFKDGIDEFYEYDLDDENCLDDIPEELLENWCIRGEFEDWEKGYD